MGSINLNEKTYSDPRFKFLAKILGINQFHAIGAIVPVWLFAQHREKYSLKKEEIDAISEINGFADAMLKSGLGKKKGNLVYLSGSKNRFEWLWQLRKNAKKGGSERVKKAQRNQDGTFAIQPSPQPSASVTTTTTITTPTTIKKEEGEGKGRLTAKPPPLWDAWIQNSKDLPKPSGCGKDRARHAWARWNEKPDFNYWCLVAKKLGESKFCNGQNDRRWKADFDFFVRPDTHFKVMEGKYTDQGLWEIDYDKICGDKNGQD